MEDTQDIYAIIGCIIGFFGSLILIAWGIKIAANWLDKKFFNHAGKETEPMK